MGIKLSKLGRVCVAIMLVMSLGGCGTSSRQTSGETESAKVVADDSTISKESPYYGKNYDLADKVNIVMYVLGDVPNDMQKVLDEANSKYFEPNLNTTVDIKFLNWSDYTTKYSLLLSGGEDVDLIYTAAWCYYNEEVSKGAFLELTPEFLERNMPYTYAEQPQESWQQIAISNKVYAVPKGKALFNSYNFVMVRQDLIDQYKLTVPKDWNSYKEYLYELVNLQKETGVIPLKTNTNREQLLSVFLQNQKIEAVANGYNWNYYNNDSEVAPKVEDIFYLYTSDVYKDYCLEMAEMANRGVWSSDAINDSSDAQAYFENGTSGSLVWNTTLYSSGKNLESSGNGTYGVYDLTPDTLRRRGSYADDAIAITYSSKNPERAALVLDYMKSDVNLNRLLLGGIEGEHWKLDEAGNRITLDKVSDYVWNGWAWAINRQDEPDETGIDERQVVMDEQMVEKEYHPVVAGFTFDPSKVETEYTVIKSIISEYAHSFALGIYGDQTEATFEKFKATLESAGIDKVTQELISQYNAYIAAQSK